MKKLSASLEMFFSSSWLAYIALFLWAQPVEYITSKIIAPLSMMLFFTYLGVSASGWGAVSFYLIGNVIQIAAINGVYGVTTSIGEERKLGTLVYVLSAPANRVTMFIARAFFHVLDGGLSVSIGFILGALLLQLNLSHLNIVGLLLSILISSISVCGLGLLLGSITMVRLNTVFLINTVYFLLLLFDGSNIAPQAFPTWMQLISSAIPLSHGIAAARLLVKGATLGDVLPLLAGELAIGAIYAAFGLLLFNFFEARARRTGSLESA